MIVGDVQGKGLEAVETAAVVLGAFREAAYDEPDLRSVGARLERAADRELRGEKFVTTVLTEIGDYQSVTLLNYGHPAPLFVRSDGTVDFAEPPCIALPLGLGMSGTSGPEPYDAVFRPGDQLLLYIDGVTEARDRTDRFYPLSERAVLLEDPDPEAALQTLRADPVEHVEGPLGDDAAMLLLRYHDPA
ncbi:hypothetical protein GCM10009730_61670 [Streptomyces albidochromogenes]|nr:PP2C family protein-serine/threonine phosphatase [Streptomyces albidochromogenes]